MTSVFIPPYPKTTEPASAALFEALASVASQLPLSPREKRKVFLEIANPRPNSEGITRTRISLFHAERHIKNGRAVRVDEMGVPSAEGEWLVFRNPENIGTTVTAEWLTRRVTDAPALPMCMSSLTGTDLWPVLPHPAGRSLPDFLANEAHLKASRRSSSGSEGKQ